MAKKRVVDLSEVPDSVRHRKSQLNVELPREVLRKFKAYCVRRGLKIRDRILELITEDVNRETLALRDETLIRRNTK